MRPGSPTPSDELRNILSSKLPVSLCSSYSTLAHGPPGCHPFSPAIPSPQWLPSQHSTPWHRLQYLGEMENWHPTPSDHISFIIFLMPREADSALVELSLFGLPHGNRITHSRMFPPSWEYVIWFLRRVLWRSFSFLCRDCVTVLSPPCLVFSSVFSFQTVLFSAFARGECICCEIQLLSLLGPNARLGQSAWTYPCCREVGLCWPFLPPPSPTAPSAGSLPALVGTGVS